MEDEVNPSFFVFFNILVFTDPRLTSAPLLSILYDIEAHWEKKLGALKKAF